MAPSSTTGAAIHSGTENRSRRPSLVRPRSHSVVMSDESEISGSPGEPAPGVVLLEAFFVEVRGRPGLTASQAGRVGNAVMTSLVSVLATLEAQQRVDIDDSVRLIVDR